MDVPCYVVPGQHIISTHRGMLCDRFGLLGRAAWGVGGRWFRLWKDAAVVSRDIASSPPGRAFLFYNSLACRALLITIPTRTRARLRAARCYTARIFFVAHLSACLPFSPRARALPLRACVRFPPQRSLFSRADNCGARSWYVIPGCSWRTVPLRRTRARPLPFPHPEPGDCRHFTYGCFRRARIHPLHYLDISISSSALSLFLTFSRTCVRAAAMARTLSSTLTYSQPFLFCSVINRFGRAYMFAYGGVGI